MNKVRSFTPMLGTGWHVFWKLLIAFPSFASFCIFVVKPKLKPIVPTPQKNRIEVSCEEGPTGADKATDQLPADDREDFSNDAVTGEELYLHSPSVL